MALPKGLKTKPYYKYAVNVVNGKIIAGELLKLSCKRFLSDLERKDLVFKTEIVDRFIAFSQLIKHFKGSSSGKPFKLEPWQQFIAANILGFYWKKTDIRRFTNSLICMSRKQGKTALAALFCLWFLIGDGEDGSEVNLAANSRAQSSIAFEFVEQYAKQLDPKGKDLKIYRNGIKCNLNVGKLNVFAADSTKLDGYNGHLNIIDEYHAAKDSKLYDVLKSSQGQRKQPHQMVISTVGFDLSSPFKKLYDTDCEILHGVKKDDSTFVVIYALDENDDWTDEKNWLKIAPNLDITVSKKYLKEQVTQAKNNASSEVGILTKNFNKWCNSSEIWISDNYINAVTDTVDINDFTDCETYVGVDLAAVSDITAVSYLIRKEDTDTIYFKTDYYLPETMLTESPNREIYKYWHRTGQLKITQGNVTDYSFITNDLMQNYEKLSIKKIAYDQWNSTQWAIEATENGLPLEPYSQSIGNFNKPTREIERLIRSKKVVIDNNEITRWMFRNVALKSDHNGNTKPNKGAGKDKKIDGIIAMIEALGVELDTPRYTGGIFVL